MSGKNIDIVTKELGIRIESLVQDALDARGGSMEDLIKDIGQAVLEISSKTVYRWRKGYIEERYFSHIAKYFGVHEQWLRVGEGPKYVERDVEKYSENSGNPKYLQEMGRIGLMRVSQNQNAAEIPEQLIAENALKLINFSRMKTLIEQGAGEEQVAFQHIYRYPHEGETYRVRFVAYVEIERGKTPPAPEPKNEPQKPEG